MNTEKDFPEWLLKLEPQVRQFCELERLKEQLAPVLNVPGNEETTTHMAVRLVTEREIRERQEYLCEVIARCVVLHFRECGIVPKYPGQRTNHNER